MEINQNKNELHLYPINDNDYIGAISVDVPNTLNFIRTAVVLDSSGPMGDIVPRFVREILPLVMSKLNYAEDYKIHLITFATQTKLHVMGDTDLKHSSIRGGGETKIASAIEMLRSTLERMYRDNPSTPIRVLTVSGGDITDRDNAEKETKKLTDFLATSELTINSQAVRLFTSNALPDTKALSYLLQINNCTTTNLCDLKAIASNETISNAIVAQFQMDSFGTHQTLQFEKSIVLKFPWNSCQSWRILLVPGFNIFWLKLVPGWNIFRSKMEPTGTVKLDSGPIKVITEGQLTLAMFYQLMEIKLAYIADQMAILKVMATHEANRTAYQIVTYFKMKEDAIARKCSSSNNEIITKLLNGIASNETEFRDSAEMAEYLRKTHKEIGSRFRKEKEAYEQRQQEEEERLKREEEECLKRIEKEEIKRREEERIKREEEERIKREEEERIKREEEERIKREEEERIKEEEDQRNKKGEEERIQREEDERIRREEDERIRKEEEERIKREEEERIKREEEERIKREEMEGIKSEEERAKRKGEECIDQGEEEKLRMQKQKIEEAEFLKRKEEERELKLKFQKMEAGELFELQLQKKSEGTSSNDLQHINEKEEFIQKKNAIGNFENITEKSHPPESRRSKNSLITTAANKVRRFAGALRSNRSNDSNPNPIQTVFILDESLPVEKKNWRFTEKIIPLVFSKISNEKSQLVHLLTVHSDTTPVVQMLHSLLQTLDAGKRVRILVLTILKPEQDHQEIERFAETLIKFLNGSNFSYELQVVRLASECRQSWLGINATTKYQLFDIDAKKSNAFIATRIFELFSSNSFQVYEEKQPLMVKENYETQTQSTAGVSLEPSSKQSKDLRRMNCEFCGTNIRKYHRSYYAIFLIIFAIPITLLLFDIYISFRK